MRIPRIFIEAEFAPNQTYALSAEASRYVGRALRLAAGAELCVFNGRGGSWQAVLSFDGNQALVTPQAFNATEVESPLQVTLLQAIGRGERMDYAIQKAVELGVTSIQPIFSERTVVRLDGERLVKRQQHWLGIARAACEQSGRNIVPSINTAMPLKDALAATNADAKLLLAPSAKANQLTTVVPASVALLIGPEGGLSDAEIAEAEEAGWQSWQLGPRVLRTETAGLAALAVLQSRWGDF